MLDVDALADVLVLGAKQYIDDALAPVMARLLALESRPPEIALGFAGAIRNQDGHLIVSLTNGQLVDVGPVNGKDGAPPPPAEIEALVTSTVAAQFAKMEPAPAGRDSDAAEVAAIVMPGLEASLRDFAALTIAALPKAENGRDADPAEMTQAVAAEVARQMAMVRVPKDGEPGKDAEPPDPEMLRGLIVAELATLPPAKDGEAGKDADPAEVAALLRSEIEGPLVQRVTDAIAAIPELAQPKDGLNGRDADSAEVAALLKSEMEPVVRALAVEIVSALPPAKDGTDGTDGKSVDVAEVAAVMEPIVRTMANEWLAAIPPSKDGLDGKDADPVETERLVVTEVARQMAALPPAKNGEDAKPEDVARAVAAEVERVAPGLVGEGLERAVAALPKPQDGHTPTEEDILPLVARTVDAAVQALPKAKDGVDGKRGASVMDAEINADGQMVQRMSDGRNVVVQGRVRGKDGEDGKTGKKGDPGRDAVEITIRPGIDETRSYAPGIYTVWRGGVIAAVRQTDPIVDDDIAAAGWIVVLNGVAQDIVRETDDGRTVERMTTYTNGRSFTHRTKTATPIYRGVWRDGEYQRGDMVTHGGSLWHCDKDTTGGPEQSRDWTLAAKRGRDGKETVKLPQTPRGPVKL